MRKFLLVVFVMTFAVGLMAQDTHLKVGDMAPDFTLRATTGGEITLSSFRGKSNVVVGFFPAAFTGGCTREANAYTSGIEKFKEVGAEVMMVSTNAFPTLQHWAGELGATFPLVSDFGGATAKAYGVLRPNGFANRTTFVIDKEGKIQHIEAGNDATDPNGALTVCTRIKH